MSPSSPVPCSPYSFFPAPRGLAAGITTGTAQSLLPRTLRRSSKRRARRRPSGPCLEASPPKENVPRLSVRLSARPSILERHPPALRLRGNLAPRQSLCQLWRQSVYDLNSTSHHGPFALRLGFPRTQTRLPEIARPSTLQARRPHQLHRARTKAEKKKRRYTNYVASANLTVDRAIACRLRIQLRQPNPLCFLLAASLVLFLLVRGYLTRLAFPGLRHRLAGYTKYEFYRRLWALSLV